ncbi:MAG: dihydrofolate reductase, partial [Anaerolineae bacterium]|nr:dihydrofolate reductase [Anaerolineae bacterium]
KAEETTSNDVLLLGRVTYEGFAEAWPQRTDEASGGKYFNGVRKYVVSNTLDKAEWNNSQIISGDVLEEIRKLKAQDGENLVVHGSGTLVQWLMQHDLVDTYRLLVYPVVLGEGKRLFAEGVTATLQLVDARTFSSGVTALIYEPAREE